MRTRTTGRFETMDGARRTAGRSALCVVLAAMLFAPVLLPRAAAAKMPSGEEVLQKAVDAMGGEKAMQGLNNRWMLGRMEIPAMGLKASIQSYAERPARTRTSMRSDALGAMEQGETARRSGSSPPWRDPS